VRMLEEQKRERRLQYRAVGTTRQHNAIIFCPIRRVKLAGITESSTEKDSLFYWTCV
jgi:hypothetical protein